MSELKVTGSLGMFKIVGHSNCDDERVDEFLVCESITDESVGKVLLKSLTDMVTEHSFYYYKLVPQDYILYKFEP